MTEERLEPAESQNNAINIVQLLINFEFPKASSEVAGWLRKIKILQELLSKFWNDDRTGKVMTECLNVLYDVIAQNHTLVSPAVWCILELVEEKKISEIVEGILNNPNTNKDIKVQNALIAIIDGLCQSATNTEILQDWALAIVQELEVRKKYALLTTVAEQTILKLMLDLRLTLFRPLIYPVFRQFLYSVVTPNVFYEILDKVPHVILAIEKVCDDKGAQICVTDFAALLRLLMERFPAKPHLEEKYSAIWMAIMKIPEIEFEPGSLILWNTNDCRNSLEWSIQPVPWNDISSETPYKGLINQGNTCFMNSVLQIMYMTTRFRNEMLQKKIDSSERAATDLQQLFAFMQESDRNVLVPNGVMDSTLPPTFRRGHQQDSSEYLIYLLDTLHENESKIIRRKRYPESPEKSYLTKKIEGNGDFEGASSLKQSSDAESTVVDRLFGGVTLSTTTCSFCNKSFPKNDSFRDLHLSVPDDHKLCDLQELINVSLEPEELCSENMYDCSSCGTKRNATRKQTIIKAPPHLILTLKLFRFDPVRKQRLKLHTRLKSAKSIELPVYNSSQSETRAVTYDVKGVVLHSGASLDGGHYFSSAVDHSGQWYIFNDSIVSVAKYKWSGCGGTPYILVLRQSDMTDPPKGVLSKDLQLLVKRDNQKYLAERRMVERKRDYDDDWDDTPPNNGSLGGPGPSLVF